MPNSELAAVILEESLSWGVRDFIVCAGARNVPLILPLLDAPGEIRVWNHFDERAGAFFALGLAKRDKQPVAIVTTSGTAVAELLPAAIEAHYSGVPLVLITADRPKRFRGTGAPQSILQPGLFGEYVEGSFDCESPEEFPVDFPWNRSRPIHLNPCFEEPVKEPAAGIDWEGAMERSRAVRNLIQPSSFGDPTLLSRFTEDFEDGVVLLGELDASDRASVREFLIKFGAPIWGDWTSGLSEDSTLIWQRMALGEVVFSHWLPKKVLRIGGVPSLRFWRDLETHPEIPVLNVTSTGFSGLARPCETTGMIDFSEVDLEKRERSRNHDCSGRELNELLDRFPRSEPAMVGVISVRTMAIEPVSVFLGNSLPIREWNLVARPGDPEFPKHCFANRGANGIDGEISTFLGISEGAGNAWGIFGDLTALYDLNAPWILDQLSGGKRRLVVINNGGGRIFSRLPSMREIPEPGKTITENRHARSFEDWSRMWNLDYERWDGTGELQLASDRMVIELVPDPDQTAAFWKAFEEIKPEV